MNFSISVLIPVYNVENYIEKCAESLFNNTIADKCEFIFTNDGSTDNSIERLNAVIQKYPALKNNIVVLQHEKNMGLGATRNTGFDNAKGKYIICTDSDDWVEPDYLEELLKTAEKDDLDFVGCDTYAFEEDSDIQEIRHYPLNPNPQQCLIDILDYKVGDYLWVKLFKRDFFIHNKIRWADDISLHEDTLLDIKVLTNNPKIGYVNKPLYHYLIRKGSYVHNLYTEKTSDLIFTAIKYMDEYLKSHNGDFAREAFERRCYIMKSNCIARGSIYSQKKYLKLYKELNKYADRNNTKLFYYYVIRISNKSTKTAFVLVYIYSILKCIFGKIKYKDYVSE